MKKLGYTHVELHPVMEYLDEISGPYSTFGYFAPDRRFGLPGDFAALVNQLHKEGIGVILDWAAAHFPRYAEGLERFDGTPLYELPDRKWLYILCGEPFFIIMRALWLQIF